MNPDEGGEQGFHRGSGIWVAKAGRTFSGRFSVCPSAHAASSPPSNTQKLLGKCRVWTYLQLLGQNSVRSMERGWQSPDSELGPGRSLWECGMPLHV